jgi:hypothetical protein
LFWIILGYGGNGNSNFYTLIIFIFFKDWEAEVVLAFFGMLYSLKWRQGREDCIRWIPSKRKKFEVQLFFHELSILGGLFFSFEEYLES